LRQKFLTSIFFILLIVSVVTVTKAVLTAFDIYSSTTYSITYFAFFGCAFIFTKYVYPNMFRRNQYFALIISAVASGLSIWWLLKGRGGQVLGNHFFRLITLLMVV